jgi:hypothetical protein
MSVNRLPRAKIRKTNKPEKSAPMPPELSERLNRLATLPQNWDSYGAVPMHPKTMNRVRSVLLEILALGGEGLPLPFIAPSPDGGIELEWKTTSNKELMLDIPPVEGHMAFLLVEPTDSGDEQETEGKIGDLYTLEEVVRRLLLR